MKLPNAIRWNQIFISLLIGFALGGAFMQWNGRECGHKHWKKGGMKNHLIEKFTKELGLTEDQKAKVSAIFEKTHTQMEALHAQVKPQFEALRSETQAQIRVLLTPAQQKKFDVMNAKWEERMKKREDFFK